jgi:hypothetical protein
MKFVEWHGTNGPTKVFEDVSCSESDETTCSKNDSRGGCSPSTLFSGMAANRVQDKVN